MELFCIGVSHKTAPVEIREKLALLESEQHALLTKLSLSGEAMLVSTCNRVELYLASDDLGTARERARRLLVDSAGADVAGHLYEHEGDQAALHLFRVAASLDSMVVGEPQILGQVKDAYELAQKAGAARGELARVCHAAFACAKRVRSDTGIGRAAVSMASAAVDLARKIFGGLDGRSMLVVGAGEMSALAARHLASAGARQIVVANRSLAHAESLAREVGGVARPFEEVRALLVAADVVICSTASPRPIFTRENLAPALKPRRHRPLLMIDLAVPRDVESEVNELGGVYVYDVDDIQGVVATNAAQRAAEAARAEELVAEEIIRFVKARAERVQVPVIKLLRARAEEIVRAEVERTLSRLGELDEKQRLSIEAMGMAIANKMLHEPTIRLRAIGGAEGGERLADAAAELFGLEERGDG
ncbi:MAG TPA: glutamyl-tRNA reductase [Myxococcaceae bacterium]|nr:glutamyl-tRNA reductase [Myxococcaceae bacterium]